MDSTSQDLGYVRGLGLRPRQGRTWTARAYLRAWGSLRAGARDLAGLLRLARLGVKVCLRAQARLALLFGGRGHGRVRLRRSFVE
jgi:hypothetical protein